MDATPSTITLQDINDLPLDLLPEEIVDDPFDVLSPADQIWNRRSPPTLAENMSMNAIIMKWEMESIGSVEAFNAMVANDLLDWDLLVWMIATQHKAARKIDGGE